MQLTCREIASAAAGTLIGWKFYKKTNKKKPESHTNSLDSGQQCNDCMFLTFNFMFNARANLSFLLNYCIHAML